MLTMATFARFTQCTDMKIDFLKSKMRTININDNQVFKFCLTSLVYREVHHVIQYSPDIWYTLLYQAAPQNTPLPSSF